MNSKGEERDVYQASITLFYLFNLLFQWKLETLCILTVLGSNCSPCTEIHHKCVSESN